MATIKQLKAQMAELEERNKVLEDDNGRLEKKLRKLMSINGLSKAISEVYVLRDRVKKLELELVNAKMGQR